MMQSKLYIMSLIANNIVSHISDKKIIFLSKAKMTLVEGWFLLKIFNNILTKELKNVLQISIIINDETQTKNQKKKKGISNIMTQA